MSFLFRLNKYIAVPILIGLLTVRDLVLLEVACSHRDSQSFRSWMIQFHGILDSNVIPPCASLFSGLLQWAAKFNLNISHCLFILEESTSNFYKSVESLKPKYKNNVTKLVLKQLTNWKSLVRCMSPIVDLENLTEVYFEQGPPEIMVIIASTSVRLRRCHIKKFDFKEDVVSLLCRNCTELTDLSYADRSLSRRAIVAIVVHARKLQHLTLSYCSNHESDIFSLHCGSPLKSLVLVDCSVNFSTLLRRIGSRLTRLVLPNKFIKYEMPVSLYDCCPNLTCLSLGSCILDAAAVVGLLSHLPLRSFSAVYPLGLEDSDFETIAEHCKSLRYWGPVEYGVTISAQSMQPLMTKMTCLTSLSLRRKGLTDECIGTIAKHCKQLLELDLAGNKNLSDASIVPLIESCTLLRELDLNMCDYIPGATNEPVSIGDASAKALSLHCQDLILLSIMGCSLTDLGAVLLCDLPRALKINLGANLLTEAVLRAVVGQNDSREKKFDRYQFSKKLVEK